MGVLLNIPFEFKDASISNIKDINSSFALGTLKVMYLGKNRNGSYFSKETVLDAIPSIFNVPIVCYWDSEAGTIGGHDIEIVSDDKGLRIKNLTEPCGVVPECAVTRFSVETDENGVEHEYLVVDNVILWKRQDVYRHIVDDLGGKVKHSMEINVFDGEKNGDEDFDIKKFEFTALCLLEDAEPCFEGSKLSVYSYATDLFRSKLDAMMAELKESYSLVSASIEDDIHPHESLAKGGIRALESDITIDTNAPENEVNFNKSDAVEVAEECIVSEPEADNNVAPEGDNFATEDNEGVADTNVPDSETKSAEDFELSSNIVHELVNTLRERKFVTRWGELAEEYEYADYDPATQEVYCWSRQEWLLFGFKYTVDGDVISIDYDSKMRKKYAIVDYVNGDNQSSPFAETYNLLAEIAKSNNDTEKKYNAAAEELNDLREYKANNEAAIAQMQRDEVLSQFADLTGTEAFEYLREHCADYDLTTLEEKCYAIRGRNSVVKFSGDLKSPRIVIEEDVDSVPDNEPYGGAFVKYQVNN